MLVHPALAALQGRLIVSVQAEQQEPFYQPEAFLAMARSVVDGGAAGLRLAGARDVALAREAFGDAMPIMGLTKPVPLPDNWRECVYITPTLADALSLIAAGASLVALDGTARPRPGGETLATIVQALKAQAPQVGIIADIDIPASADFALAAGVDALATTLAGYTQESARSALINTPDWDLLAQLVVRSPVPVILEGRVASPADVAKGLQMGGFAVVVGSAITRPHLITAGFAAACASPQGLV